MTKFNVSLYNHKTQTIYTPITVLDDRSLCFIFQDVIGIEEAPNRVDWADTTQVFMTPGALVDFKDILKSKLNDGSAQGSVWWDARSDFLYCANKAVKNTTGLAITRIVEDN